MAYKFWNMIAWTSTTYGACGASARVETWSISKKQSEQDAKTIRLFVPSVKILNSFGNHIHRINIFHGLDPFRASNDVHWFRKSANIQ